MEILTSLQEALNSGEISEKVHRIFTSLYTSYACSMTNSGFNMGDFDHLFETLLTLIKEELAHPHTFEPYHERILKPYNYYQFGLEFIRPLVDESRTRVKNSQSLDKMETQLAAKENVILFANHQTEVDPQLMSLVLEKSHPKIASDTIFVAGDRVITDTMAIPFSLGRNLLCIYSKRHIDNPPSEKAKKLQHNQRTMKVMKELLSEGGKCIYMAPSGGRDRPNEKGEVVVAPFDPQSIEMFRLMSKQAKQPTHFYPLALATYDILPPPQSIEVELGEIRYAKREGALFDFACEIDIDTFPGSELTDKHAKRSARAMSIWNLVKINYAALKQEG